MIYALCFATKLLAEDSKLKIGYARVSTNEQNLSNQISLLKENGCEDIFEEKISGAKKTRPELEKLLSQIRASDTLVVCKLDRLARSTHHGVCVANEQLLTLSCPVL
jgi:DNA invertase Pin-like site-specific DNA recombinase